MNIKIKYIILTVLIIFVGLPAVALGSSITNSLIHGKSIPEAIEILTAQVDSLIKRVSVLEVKQIEQERLENCRFADSAFINASSEGGIMGLDNFEELVSKITFERDNSPQNQYQMWQSRLEKVQRIKDQYFFAKGKCDGQ